VAGPIVRIHLPPAASQQQLPGYVMTAIGIGLERHGGYPRRTMDGVASSYLRLLSRICRSPRFMGLR
jgi:hypothetical protein